MIFVRKQQGISQQKGAFMVVYAALFLLLLMLCGLVIDMGMIYNAKAELKGATDSAALAGALKLNEPEQVNSNVLNYLNMNPVQGTVITDPEITLGSWDDQTQIFDAGATDSPTAVQVTASFTGHYYFARIFNLRDYTLNSTSIASIVDNRPLNIVAAYDEQPMQALEHAISYLREKLDSGTEQILSLPIANNNLMTIMAQAQSELGNTATANQKRIALLMANGTKAWGGADFNMNALINDLKQQRIFVFRLVIGQDSYSQINQEITSQTGGSLYNAPSGSTDYTSQMDVIYDDMKKGPPRLVQ